MYELMAQGCFENSALFQQLQRLQLHRVAPRCGSGPGGHSGAAHEVTRSLVDDDLEIWKPRLNSRRRDTSQQFTASRFKKTKHVFNVSRAERLRVNDAEVRTSSAGNIAAVLVHVCAGKVVRENLLIGLPALGHHV